MIWLVLFLIGGGCAVIAVVALLIWLAVATLQGFLTCVERSLTSATDGHAITALLYVIPAWFFICAIVQGLFLAFSFCQAVL